MSACPLVVLACESLHVCTVCIWRCEHARFCVEGFYALYINFHSFIHSTPCACGKESQTLTTNVKCLWRCFPELGIEHLDIRRRWSLQLSFSFLDDHKEQFQTIYSCYAQFKQTNTQTKSTDTRRLWNCKVHQDSLYCNDTDHLPSLEHLYKKLNVTLLPSSQNNYHQLITHKTDFGGIKSSEHRCST